jgi:hypothetical protein
MAELDPYDRLLEACKNAKRYPSGYTLLKKTTSRAVLDEYYNYLLLNDSVLFARNISTQCLLLWELWPGEQRTTPTQTRSLILNTPKTG